MMARMYPPVLATDSGYQRKGGDFISNAEREVFSQLAGRLDDGWDVFHSVWLREAARGEHAEGDFVLIGPDAVVLLEIKGGYVQRNRSGEWEFLTLRGRHVKTSRRGPIEQARGAWYALKDHVRENGGRQLVDDIVWGYGVITPDCQMNVAGTDPGFSDKLWLDSSGFPESLENFLEDLADYWREDQRSRTRSGRLPVRRIKPVFREALIRVIRPVIGHIDGMGVDARAIERQLVRLTRTQYRALDYSELGPRIVIQGGAGTGKTLLAVERARREARGGKRVLFTCYNRLLADAVARQVQSDPEMSNVTVLNYHQLVKGILAQAGVSDEVPDNWKQFNAAAPDLVLEALARDKEGVEPWDYLVVDEGQDLLSKPFFSVLDMLLKGSLEKGRWLLCFDTEQALFSDQYDETYAEQLIGQLAHRVLLKENCRNTRQVSAYGHAIGKIESRTVSSITGPIPQFEYIASMIELKRELKRALNRMIADFRSAKLGEDRITVLLAQRGEYEKLVKELCSELLCPCHWCLPDVAPIDGMVQVSTVQAYKGLESDAIFLVGLDSLERDWQRRLFYVAATRARSIFEVFLPEISSVYVEDATSDVLRLSMENNISE